MPAPILAKGRCPLVTETISKDRKNNFGFLRLAFATLVILSHSPEMIDGNRSRELLTRVFKTVSFGEVAVDGFFLVSGYLITLSLLQSKSKLEYLLKRALRIYPGYLIAFFVSLFIFGPLAGGTIADLRSMLNVSLFEHLVLLEKPELQTAFQHMPKPYLSGTMWSLAYEFRCYCVLMILGAAGMLRNRKFVLIMTMILMQGLVISRYWRVFLYFQHIPIPPQVGYLVGDPLGDIRCYALFFCGSCFFLFRDKIVYHWKSALVAAVILINLMFVSAFAEAAFAILGGYLLFWFALTVKSDVLSRVGNRYDLSYGVYLYAWPIQNLLIWHYRHISPWLLFVIALPVSGLMAFFSWVCVERPSLQLKRRLRLKGASGLLGPVPQWRPVNPAG